MSPKQSAFVREYLIDLNAAQAAIRAGYSSKGAKVQGCRLLTNVNVAAAIKEALEKRGERTEVNADRVVMELARIAFLDPRRVMKWGPNGVEFHDSERLADDDAACIVEASQTITESGGTIRVKLADKTQALTLLGRHLGMFTDQLRVEGAHENGDGVREVIVRTREEAAAMMGPREMPAIEDSSE